MSQDHFEIWYIFRRLTSYHTLHSGALNFIVMGTYLIPMLYEIVLGTKVQRYGVNIPNFKMILRYILNYRND